MNKKVIVITGASDGLGKAMSEELISDNEVVLVSKNEVKLKEVADKLKCAYFACDVTDYKVVDNIIKEIIKNHSKIDVLINNAGVWLDGDIVENSYEQISTCIDVNTKGMIYMVKAVLPFMDKEKNGLIINVCSQASFNNDSFSPIYNASKWAMRGFNRSMENNLSKKNIKITGFYPGFMQTKLFAKAGNDLDTSTGLEIKNVAKVVRFITQCDKDMVIPEFGVKDIKNV
jgi:NADP-dependent 3-hydroxy acid dehydrogenase YdfG